MPSRILSTPITPRADSVPRHLDQPSANHVASQLHGLSKLDIGRAGHYPPTMNKFAVALLSILASAAAVGAADSSALLTTGASARQVPRNVDMSVRRGNEAETAIAIFHLNPKLITSVSNLEINGLFHSWSTDGGRTWQNNVIANGTDGLGTACCDAQLASDDFGNIFLTYLSSSIAVQMAISTDGGATFQSLGFLTSLPFGLPVYPWKSLAAIGQSVAATSPPFRPARAVFGFRGRRLTGASRRVAHLSPG